MKSPVFKHEAPFSSSHGYIINYSGLKKPVAIYVRHFTRPVGKCCDFLERHGFIRFSKNLNKLDSKILKVLLRRFHPIVWHEGENTAKTLVLSNDKNSD